MSERLVIYGASGYSGRLIAARARTFGLEPLLCGRNAAKLEHVAAELGLEFRAFSLRDDRTLDDALACARVVVNAAGPFADTALPIAEACLRCGAHYLDITAENPVIERLARLHERALAAGVMIMPAVGFDVVPSDCLALDLARQLGRLRHLRVAVSTLGFLTRGSAKTLVRAVNGGLLRRDGRIVHVPIGSLKRTFDFGAGPTTALSCSLGDIASGYYTTGAPNIETYVEAPPAMHALLFGPRMFGPLLQIGPLQATMMAFTELLPEDPTVGRRATAERYRMTVVVEAESWTGERLAARLHTPEAYAFTGVTATAIAALALDGDVEPGFQTPARVYGSDFVLRFADVERDPIVDCGASAAQRHTW